MPLVILVIAVIVVIAVVLSLALSLVGFALGLVFSVIGLALKLLPWVLVALVVAFFACGGRVKVADGKVELHLPGSWRK